LPVVGCEVEWVGGGGGGGREGGREGGSMLAVLDRELKCRVFAVVAKGEGEGEGEGGREGGWGFQAQEVIDMAAMQVFT